MNEWIVCEVVCTNCICHRMSRDTACTVLCDNYTTEYQNVMDSQNAVSNYEAEILEVVKLKKSDKDSWKTGLKPESACTMSYVKEFIAKNNSNDVHYHETVDSAFLDSVRKNYNLAQRRNTRDGTSVYSPSLVQQVHLPQSCRLSNGNASGLIGQKVNTALQHDPTVPSAAEHLGPLKGFKRKQPLPDVVEDKRVKRDLHSFHTARMQLAIEDAKKFGNRSQGLTSDAYGSSKKCLGGLAYRKNSVNNRFIPPVLKRDCEETTPSDSGPVAEWMVDERLKNIDAKMVEMIMNEIMDDKQPVSWDDIAGLDFAKKMVKEMVVLPMIRPDFCTRLRRPPKGLLLFGPPGTGKTLIGKVIASNSKSTFFSISASSLTSKWIGEGEKMVRALFTVARCHQPSVIFIDEIDSLLTQRNDSEHEASRRIKTEFLVQLDGTTSQEDDKILVVGATNRPQELDEAARRRLSKRLYIPLPDVVARKQIVCSLMCDENHVLSDSDISDIGQNTEGYSGADMANLCKEAAYGPIRELSFEELENMPSESVRPVNHRDFILALSQVKASVSDNDLKAYEDWNHKFGSTSHQ